MQTWCAVASLGAINFYHPAFHTEQSLFPVGYAATRTMTSPASPKSPAAHLCQILADPAGDGPVFRWAPGSKPKVQAPMSPRLWLVC